MADSNKIYTILFMGSSGSGKDTQAGLLRDFLEKRGDQGGVLDVSTGNILREAAKKETYIAKFIHKIVLEKGKKIPDLLALWAIGQALINEMKEGQHLIFSSSPRSIFEAELLDNLFLELGRKKVFYIYLDVSRDEAVRRLLDRGRPDDNIDAINNRLDFFEEWVFPALDYCRAKSPYGLIEIDGSPHDEQKIHNEILRAIGLNKL